MHFFTSWHLYLISFLHASKVSCDACFTCKAGICVLVRNCSSCPTDGCPTCTSCHRIILNSPMTCVRPACPTLNCETLINAPLDAGCLWNISSAAISYSTCGCQISCGIKYCRSPLLVDTPSAAVAGVPSFVTPVAVVLGFFVVVVLFVKYRRKVKKFPGVIASSLPQVWYPIFFFFSYYFC